MKNRDKKQTILESRIQKTKGVECSAEEAEVVLRTEKGEIVKYLKNCDTSSCTDWCVRMEDGTII